MSLIFDDVFFTYPNFEIDEVERKERAKLKKMVYAHGGKFVKLDMPERYLQRSVLHLRPDGYQADDLDPGVKASDIVRADYVAACIEQGVLLDTAPFVVYHKSSRNLPSKKTVTTAKSLALLKNSEAAVGSDVEEAENENKDEIKHPPPPPPPSRGIMTIEDELEQDGVGEAVITIRAGEKSPYWKRGTKRANNGVSQWSAFELRTLFNYCVEKVREGRDMKGDKVWREAEKMELLPGRTYQGMKAKAKREFLSKVLSNTVVTKKRRREAPSDSSGPLLGTDAFIEDSGEWIYVESLVDETHQPAEHVVWVLYHTSGNVPWARAILLSDNENTIRHKLRFKPWREEEDITITTFARGIIVASLNPPGDKQSLKEAVLKFNNEDCDEKLIGTLETLLTERKLKVLADRAKFLVDTAGIF
mmetsp:Transcript_20794/g.34414  ORF Transcript_20794/g.34414 Transcript_20794/m.34414 type:complete len:418 (+) Transcript_20794:175-1428(+)|eukprot:CAMPEP_0203746276 /NCGR_PEP_ID=MMETSP0098-20131031/1763_1 /ASSEMBLY_ACC=CAM_ASM_000208 /TAXON_ID=96639 /ORGANISM=" , Strain NY0313808BC1" /LENGTH=417 /DNA_ID=CAMNT_0050634305 /DNA_START=124 /DNA_END=1377 /DNA_ORIENTATION=-